MPVPALLLAAGFGAKLGGALLSARSQRRRRRALRDRLMETVRPLEALLAQTSFGPSETEGSLMQSATTRTLRDLAGRGVISSSIAAPAVAAAVAPYEEQRQGRRQSLLERIAAAKQAIYSETELPGYGEALGGMLGETGDVLSLFYGMQSGQGGPSAADILGDQQVLDRSARTRDLVDTSEIGSLMRRRPEDVLSGGRR